MGLCGCKGSVEWTLRSRTVSRSSIPQPGKRPTVEIENLETLNAAGRMILQRTMAKRGDKGVEMDWLNFMLAKMWPHIHETLKQVVAKDLEPKIKDALPSVFGTVSFKTFSLGEKHPEIREIGVAHGKQNQYDGLELDLKIIWNCNADIAVDVQGIEIGIENVRIDGTVRLQLRPLLQHLPSIGGVQITMMSPPNISWNFRGIFAALQADVVSRVMRQVVSDQISELLVVPNLIFVHWLDSEADVDLEVLQFPHPECVVRLCIQEARDLLGSDWNYFGFNGTSDPYVSVHLGSHHWYTPQKSRTRNPKWGDAGYHDFFVYTPSQFVKVDVYDSDIGPGTDDHLGFVEGLTVQWLLEKPRWWWPLRSRKKPAADFKSESTTVESPSHASKDNAASCGEVLIEAHFLELRATEGGHVPRPMGKAEAVAYAFIDLRSLRGLQPKQADGATITFRLEGQSYKSRAATYKATSYGSALTPGAQRLVEHLHNTKGRSVDEIMKISGLTKEQVTSVVLERPSFTTKWHQPISLPIRDLDQAQLEISLGIRRLLLGGVFGSAPTTTCGGELLGDYFYDRSKSSADVVAKCNSKCEQMQQQNRLCHCWTLTTTHCDFYHMPLDLLVNTVPVDSADEPCWNHSAAVNVYPTLVQNTNGRTSYFPLMKRFVHTTNRPAGSTTFFANAYGSTQGFLQGVHYWTQEQVDDFVRWQSGTNSSLGAPSSQGLMFQQLNDWILGGFLGRTTGYLVVDWMNWNPNHDVVSWMVLKFKVDASGLVSSGRSVNHLVIPQSDLDQVREDPNSIFWPGFNVWHGLYILLVAYYFCKEVYELFTSGLRYFTGWQLLVDVGLLLHIAVIGLRYYHHSVASNFTKELAKDSADALVLDIATFEAEAVAWSNFLLASCFMMVFLFAGLVQYLSDLVPRISVLVDTVSRSITPVFFLVIILCDVFFAFVIWCNLLFGKTVRDFSNIQVTAISLTEMLFGRLDVVESLRIYFPITGFFFYLFFMVLFFFILQYLSRAIVLTSFDDATRSFEERQRTKKLLGDQLASFFKLQVAWAKKSLGLNFRAKDLKTAGGLEPYPTHKWGVVPFTFFCGIYVIFVSMALWVPEGHDVVLSLTEALKRPTFAKVNPLSREIDSELHFDQIETREDVLRWLAVSFSKTLYNSSSSDNVLGSYAASPEYKQVVINDWNILLGQTPVRLSLNYDTMVPVSNNSVTARLPVAHVIRTEEPVTNVEDLKDPLAQDLLQQYCGNYTTEIGFSCMLSVDPSVTIPTLLDMRLKGITTNQTSAMTLDFVAYNGIIDMFFYVKINFDFTTSGYIDKDVKIYPIKLPDLTSSFFPIRLILEIFIIAFTVGRLAKCMRAVYRVALAGIKKGKAGAFGHRLMVVLQVLLFHILQHPFIIFDFLSGISTLVTLVMWYSFVLLDLTQTFYFAESPAWTPAQCADTGLCSDFTAISKFSQASQQMRFFTQICAANTVFLFLCYLKYLSAFRTGRVIARAMLNGTADLLCFFVVMVVLLMGYVCMGHTIFGTIMVDFSSLGYAVITCFQMFLGTFRSFAAMRQANSIAYYFYWYTYMVLFRYVMANMFFAIVAKHFQKEDQALEEKLGQEQAAEKGTFMDNLKGDMKLALKNVLGMVKPSKDPNEKLEEDNDGIESVAGEDLDPVSTPKSPRHSSTFAGREIETSPTEVDESFISSENVSEPNWRFLPDETRQWAVDTAKEIYRFIHEKSRLREEVEKHNKEQFDIDHVQEEAETAIQEKAFDLGKKAEKVKLDLSTRELRSLKAVHRDQESLAWYIMKRETELKKLEEAKSVKMDRYEKMVNATQLLVASDESQEPGPSSKSLTAGDPGQ